MNGSRVQMNLNSRNREGTMDQNIRDVLSLQDVQLANAMTNLKDNPNKLTSFIQQQRNSLYNTVTKEHSDNFQKVFNDLQNAGNTVKNITYYHVRNKDLDATQEAIFGKAQAEADAATYDSQVAKRQFEINEWTSGNKMDTLFIMQMMFIGLTLIAPLLYMVRIGMVPMSVFSMISFLIFVAILLTFVVRYQYHDKSRDLRFFNRRRFASMGGPPTPPTCESVQELASSAVASSAAAFDSAKTQAVQLSDKATNMASVLGANFGM
jgi:NADH:ubiquinone oxidoreductase subunit 3 (subunit A)